jgi:hypothetical protein
VSASLARYKIKRDAAKAAAQAAPAAPTAPIARLVVSPRPEPARASTPPEAQAAPPPRPTPSVKPVSQNLQADAEAFDPTCLAKNGARIAFPQCCDDNGCCGLASQPIDR